MGLGETGLAELNLGEMCFGEMSLGDMSFGEMGGRQASTSIMQKFWGMAAPPDAPRYGRGTDRLSYLDQLVGPAGYTHACG